MFTEEGPSAHTLQQWPAELHKAFKAQELIGWEQVLYGRLSKQWKDLATDTATGSYRQWTRKPSGSSGHMDWTYGPSGTRWCTGLTENFCN